LLFARLAEQLQELNFLELLQDFLRLSWVDDVGSKASKSLILSWCGENAESEADQEGLSVEKIYSIKQFTSQCQRLLTTYKD
jgi:hypothetical protein